MAKTPTIIKKYGNRRLYDTAESRYITLEDLADKVRTGTDVRIVAAKSGEAPAFAGGRLRSEPLSASGSAAGSHHYGDTEVGGSWGWRAHGRMMRLFLDDAKRLHP